MNDENVWTVQSTLTRSNQLKFTIVIEVYEYPHNTNM